MTTVSFDASSLHRVTAKLAMTEKEIDTRCRRVVAKSLRDIEADAKVFAPVDTGDLENSISTDIYPGGLSGEVGPTVEYGADVEWGTRPHQIRNAFGYIDVVNHPGTDPQPYMRPAADRRIPQFRRAVEQIGGNIL